MSVWRTWSSPLEHCWARERYGDPVWYERVRGAVA
jgi:hypothetical protein